MPCVGAETLAEAKERWPTLPRTRSTPSGRAGSRCARLCIPAGRRAPRGGIRARPLSRSDCPPLFFLGARPKWRATRAKEGEAHRSTRFVITTIPRALLRPGAPLGSAVARRVTESVEHSVRPTRDGAGSSLIAQVRASPCRSVARLAGQRAAQTGPRLAGQRGRLSKKRDARRRSGNGTMGCATRVEMRRPISRPAHRARQLDGGPRTASRAPKTLALVTQSA